MFLVLFLHRPSSSERTEATSVDHGICAALPVCFFDVPVTEDELKPVAAFAASIECICLNMKINFMISLK